ncbi:MAG: dienelactone hydrolase family protein [Robiginitalea sp.]
MILPQSIDTELEIPIGRFTLKGRFCLPDTARGIVLFSHGSGSSRNSPRNNYVAKVLQQQHLGTLLFDLLTESEDTYYENRFNIGMLTRRLISVTDWVLVYSFPHKLPIGYFGASTGAASALRAAAHFKEQIAAVVCRGGRPDMAMEDIPLVTAPTLFLVGSRDTQVIEFNQKAQEAMQAPSRLKLVNGASHLFEEPGKLQEVADLSAGWFSTHFQK